MRTFPLDTCWPVVFFGSEGMPLDNDDDAPLPEFHGAVTCGPLSVPPLPKDLLHKLDLEDKTQKSRFSSELRSGLYFP